MLIRLELEEAESDTESDKDSVAVEETQSVEEDASDKGKRVYMSGCQRDVSACMYVNVIVPSTCIQTVCYDLQGLPRFIFKSAKVQRQLIRQRIQQDRESHWYVNNIFNTIILSGIYVLTFPTHIHTIS